MPQCAAGHAPTMMLSTYKKFDAEFFECPTCRRQIKVTSGFGGTRRRIEERRESRYEESEVVEEYPGSWEDEREEAWFAASVLAIEQQNQHVAAQIHETNLRAAAASHEVLMTAFRTLAPEGQKAVLEAAYRIADSERQLATVREPSVHDDFDDPRIRDLENKLVELQAKPLDLAPTEHIDIYLAHLKRGGYLLPTAIWLATLVPLVWFGLLPALGKYIWRPWGDVSGLGGVLKYPLYVVEGLLMVVATMIVAWIVWESVRTIVWWWFGRGKRPDVERFAAQLHSIEMDNDAHQAHRNSEVAAVEHDIAELRHSLVAQSQAAAATRRTQITAWRDEALVGRVPDHLRPLCTKLATSLYGDLARSQAEDHHAPR